MADDDESDSGGDYPVARAPHRVQRGRDRERARARSHDGDVIDDLEERVKDLELTRAALLGTGEGGDAGRLGRLEDIVTRVAKRAEATERWKTGLKAQLVIVIGIAGTLATIAMHFLDRILR